MREEKKIDFIDTIFTYDELVHLGYLLPNPQMLLLENFAHKLADEVLPENVAKDVGDALDRNLDEIISKMLEGRNITVKDDAKQGLKNLYLSSVMNAIKSSGRT
jgi:hypothetical protein